MEDQDVGHGCARPLAPGLCHLGPLLDRWGKVRHRCPALSQRDGFSLLGERSQQAQERGKAHQWYSLAFSLQCTAAGGHKFEAGYLRFGGQDVAALVCKESAGYHLRVCDVNSWVGTRQSSGTLLAGSSPVLWQGRPGQPCPLGLPSKGEGDLDRAEGLARADAADRGALGARPDLRSSYLSVGHMRWVQEDYGGALGRYREVERVAPERDEPKRWVGFTHLREEYPAAEGSFRAALVINPKHGWSAHNPPQSLY